MLVNRRLVDWLSDKRAQRGLLLVLLWIPAVILLVAVREVLLPFFVAAALAYVIAPGVRWISARRIAGRSLPRPAAVILLYLITAVVLFVGGRIFVPQLYKEVKHLGSASAALFSQLSDENIARQAHALEAWIKTNELPIHIVTAEDEDVITDVPVGTSAIPLGPRPRRLAPVHNDGGAGSEPGGTIHDVAPDPSAPHLDHDVDVAEDLDPPRVFRLDLLTTTQNLVRDAKLWAKDASLRAVGQLQGALAKALGFLFSCLLVLMLTAFIVADTERFTSFLYTITPVRDRDTLQDLLGRIDRGLSGVVRGQLTICIINGVLTLVGLLLLKVKFAFLLATVAAVFSLVPVFGSILSTIPIVIVALGSGPSTAVLAVLWILGIHAVEANLLNPKIMGEAAKIHPVLVVLALVIGEHFYGLAGALFAVPIMSVLVTLWRAMRTKAMALDGQIAVNEVDDDDGPPATPMRRMRLRDGG